MWYVIGAIALIIFLAWAMRDPKGGAEVLGDVAEDLIEDFWDFDWDD